MSDSTDLSNTLVIAVSATALFDLSEVARRFQEAEAVDKDEAIEEYRRAMRQAEDEPLDPGVAMPLVKALLALNKYKLEAAAPLVEVVVLSRNSPETGLRVLNSIVTARNAPADIRVIRTLRAWNVYVDEAYFLGGLKKTPILQAIKPPIFFDDQDTHLDDACVVVPSAKVPHVSNSPLQQYETADKQPTTKVDIKGRHAP
ncbi:MAG: 5'-nucleotidase [Myxococcales bacterium]|nr:5'-nucleotidase [Myxococcales bacterium]